MQNDDLDAFLKIRDDHESRPLSILEDNSRWNVSREEAKELICKMIDEAYDHPDFDSINLAVCFTRMVGTDCDTFYSTYFYERERNEDDPD